MVSRLRPENQVCSFCKRTQDEVNRLIAGPDRVFICDECVDLCKEILEEEIEPVSPAWRGAATAIKRNRQAA